MANVSITKRSVFNSTTSVQYGTVCKQLIDLLVQDTNLILKGVITNTTSTYSVEYYVSSDTNSWIRFYNTTYYLYFQVYYKNSATTSTVYSNISKLLCYMNQSTGGETSFYSINVNNKLCGIIHNLSGGDYGLLWSSMTDISTEIEYSIYTLLDLSTSGNLSSIAWHFAEFSSHSFPALGAQYLGDNATRPINMPYLNPYRLYYNNIFGYIGDMNDEIYGIKFRPENTSFVVSLPLGLEFTLGNQQYISLGNDSLTIKKDNI